MTTRHLDCLFKPRSLALVGASPRAGSLGHAVLANLRAGGFKGEIGLVNPSHTEIDGLPCVGRLADLADLPDLVVFAAPRESTAALVEEAAALKVPATVVITADPEHGAQSLSARLRRLADETGIRIVGPNCLGVVAPRAGLNASFAAHPASPGDLAVVSQSGAITTSLIAWAHQHKVGFSGLVSVGDMADVNFSDLLDYFALDPATRAILLYVEAIDDAKTFMSAARAAARVKPVIVIKGGRNPGAAKAAATHTGALAGADAVYEAAFRRAGLLRVIGIDELFDAAATLGRVRAFPGDRLAILTNGGGIGVLAVDDLMDRGGRLAELPPALRARLDAFLPPAWSHANPVDIVGDADAARYRNALSALLEDRGNDAIVVMHCPTALSQSEEAAAAVAETVKKYRAATMSQKPVFAAWLGASEESIRIFESAGIPYYTTGAVRGFMHLVHWRQNRDVLMAAPPSLPVDFAPDVSAARNVLTKALAQGAKWLEPADIATLFEAYDIPIAAVRRAATPEEAAALAEPVIATHGACVVKIQSPDISHKSDVGGVVLGLGSPQAVAAATRQMLAHIAETMPNAHLDGVTIHPMVVRPHARELIAGLAEDPVFGPVIVFGRGGKAVEVINDRALALPPLDLALAHDLISRTRVAGLLCAYRDEPAADVDAVALTLVKLAQLSADFPEIQELDINPLLADAAGVIAIDARVAIAPVAVPQRTGANPRFAIAPYPKMWERTLTLRDGRRIFVRPVRPEDEDLYARYFEQISQEDLRLRFFAPVKEFSHAFIARLTQIDYARGLALCAIDEATGDKVGGVRLMLDVDHESGEYAILLRSDQKGKGLGWSLMELIIEYARNEGLRHIEGQVLGENTTMISMCQQLGFHVVDDPQAPGIKLVRLDL